jgi:hypothetical protein
MGVTLGMTELNGTLDGIGLFPLLTFLAGLKADGRLAVADRELSGDLYLSGGRVVGATFGSDSGEMALDAIGLALGHGRFTFTDVAGEPTRNLSLEPAELQRHLEQLASDRERIMAGIPSLDAVPVARLEGADEQPVALDRASLRLLLRCDGKQNVFDLARGAGLPTTLKRLAQLVELQLVKLDTTAAAATPAEPPVTSFDQPVPPPVPAPPPVPSPVDQPVEQQSDATVVAHPRRPWWQGEGPD